MNQNKEYQLYRQVAAYLRLQYPNVWYHFDYAGNNLSKAQAGMMKAIQHSKGFPDLMILHPYGKVMFLELKAEGTKLFKRDLSPVSEHIADQFAWLEELELCDSTRAYFAIGFEDAKDKIDNFLRTPNNEF